MNILTGEARELTALEKEKYPNYLYVTESEFKFTDTDNNRIITIPKGFLTDGATGGPDWGWSWIFHDYLYSTHCFDDGVACTRDLADCIMESILENERIGWYAWIFLKLSKWNIFWLFSKAWESSGKRGAEFMDL